MATAPKTKITQAQQQAETDKEDAEADDLIARLSALKSLYVGNVPVYYALFIAKQFCTRSQIQKVHFISF